MNNFAAEHRGRVRSIDLSEARPGQGIIWVNSSHRNGRYVREAEKSARTVRRFVDKAEFVLVGDALHEDLDPVFDFQTTADFGIPACLREKVHLNGQMMAKLSALRHMTWEKNLYLGSDIAALRPGIQDILGLLDHFDVVVAHAPVRIFSRGERDEALLKLPDCFPEMNCDLVAYRRSQAVGAFLSEWASIYSTNRIDHPHDQGAFRYLLLNSGLRFYVVPPEYNYRGPDYWARAIILQRRELIPAYARHHAHIAEIYGPFGVRGAWRRLLQR